MKRAPKYRRHSNDIGFVCWNKKRYYFPGKFGSPESKEAYRRFIEQNVGVITSTEPTTVLAISVKYLRHAEAYYGSDTRRHFGAIRRTCELLVKHCGRTRISELGPKAVKQWRDELVGRGLARETVNGHVGRVKAMLKWAASEELIDVSVYQSVATVTGLKKGRTPAPDYEPLEPVSWELVEPVLSQLDNPVATMLFLQWMTGARPRSICLAKPEQFKQPAGSEFMVWCPRHKTEYRGRALELPIGHMTKMALERFLYDRPREAFMFSPREGKNGSNARYNDHFEPWTYRKRIVRLQERINKQRLERDLEPLPHWTPYQIRRTKAQWARDNFGIEHAQAILGHSNVRTTEIYANRLNAMAEEVVRKSG